MTNIYFASNWGVSSTQLLNFYRRQTPNKSGVWNSIRGVDDISQADYFIVQDDTTEPVDINRTIFFGREPNHVIPRHVSNKWRNCHGFYHHEFGNMWLPQTWWVDVSYDELIDCTPPLKMLPVSIIDSGKQYLSGHKERYNFISNLINSQPMWFDVWGKICEGRENESPYFTPLPDRNKRRALDPYQFSIAIENGVTPYYFSEKFVDPIACWTIPLYYGCTNINRFFPSCFIEINLSMSPTDILDIIENCNPAEMITNMIEARQLLANKYNIWPTIEKVL